VDDTKGIIKTTDIDEQIKKSSLNIKMRNLIGSTKYAPVGSTGDDLSPEVNGIKNSAKNNVMSGQVSRLVDGIFPVPPNADTNVNIPSLDSLTSKSAALKLAFRSSTNSSNSNYQPQNILNHPNITTLIPGIGGYQYEAVDKQHPSESGTYPKETVEAKWEQLQYYEGSQWQNQQNSPTNTDGAFSSIASSGASSTASSSSSSKAEGSSLGSSLSIPKINRPNPASNVIRNNENMPPATFIPPPPSASSSARKKLQEIKRQSMKKLSNLKNQITGGGSTSGVNSKSKSNLSTNMNSRAMSSYGVSTAPGGSNGTETEKRGYGVLNRIRASKSMQNLDQITRDSYFNLRDKTSNLKAIYSSRIELRAEKPSSHYDELSDEEDDENFRPSKMDAGSDSDSDSGVGHTYDNLRKANGRRMMNPIHSRFGRVGH